MELQTVLTEFETGQMHEGTILRAFSEFMKGAGLDSRITVKVLEQFGDEGKEQATSIKVCEGW